MKPFMLKLIKLVFFCLFVGFVLIQLFLYSKERFRKINPGETGEKGGRAEKQSDEDLKIGLEINNLIKNIPLKYGDFEITIYDYRHAKFLVNTSNKESFIKWHESSEFKNIPQSMFDIK